LIEGIDFTVLSWHSRVLINDDHFEKHFAIRAPNMFASKPAYSLGREPEAT
jgi:hypothetical protein